MSLTKEKDEHPNKSVILRKIQDEFVHVIQMSLSNITTQVNNLNKYTEDLFGGISKEVDRIFFRLKVLQERVIQLTDGITNKNRNGCLSLKMMKSRNFQSTFQIEQIHSSKQLPVRMFETHDACEQALLLNRTAPSCHADRDLKLFPDASYCTELYKEKIVPESKEEMGVKFKQKHKDHPNKPESVPQSQLMRDGVSVCHVPAAGTEVSHSDVDQPDGSSSFSSLQLCDINETETRAVGKSLSSSPHWPKHVAGEVKNSVTYVNYGTGMGEELQPQPRNRLKTKVFVSPTAPGSPPPLPTDWLALLRASKTETPSPIIHPPTQFTSAVLRTLGATPPTSCLPSVPEAAVLIIPRKVDCSTPSPEPFPYCEPTADDLLSHGDDQGVPPPPSPSPVPSLSVQTRATASDLSVSASVAQPPISLVFPFAGSYVQSPTPSVEKLVSSIPSSPKSSLLSPESYCITPPRYTITQLPRSSTSQNSVPLSSVTSCPQTSRSFTSSPINSCDQLRNPVAILSRCSDEQSSTSPAAPSQRSAVAQPRRHILPPQPGSSGSKSPRPSTLQSLFSSVQSPSCTSSPGAPSVSPSPPASVSATSKHSPSTVPIITKAKNVLMEAMKRGVLLHKTKAKIDTPSSDASYIDLS